MAEMYLLGGWAKTPLIEALPWQALRRRAVDLKLKDKVALITGSSRGIGLATAKAFAAEGCCLVLSARSAEPLAAAETVLRADGVAVASCIADVGQPDQAAARWRRQGMRTRQDLGRCQAGVARPRRAYRPTATT